MIYLLTSFCANSFFSRPLYLFNFPFLLRESVSKDQVNIIHNSSSSHPPSSFYPNISLILLECSSALPSSIFSLFPSRTLTSFRFSPKSSLSIQSYIMLSVVFNLPNPSFICFTIYILPYFYNCRLLKNQQNSLVAFHFST